MTDLFPGADRFGLILRGLRNSERFAVGRRLLSVVALGVLADAADPGAWRRLRGILHSETLDEARDTLLGLANAVEARMPALARVFSQILVNDVIHSRSFAETISGALAVLGEWGQVIDLKAFGAWFSAALDDASNGGPSVGDIATSRSVSELLVGLVDLQPGQTLYDPCSGLAGLLALASERIDGLSLVGRDIHPISWAFGELRLQLLGATATMELGDSLDQRPSQFDRIVCDPPSGQYADRRGLLRTSPGSGGNRRYEALFVDHCAASLKAGGRGVVLVNQGFLARRGLDEDIRRSLVGQGLVEGIIALPSGFSPWTSAELAILVLSDPPAARHDIRMIDVSRMPGWQKGRQRDVQEIMPLLLETYLRKEETAFATTVSSEFLFRSGQFRPGHHFVATIERRSVPDLLGEADAFEARANVEASRISDILQQLNLRDDEAI